MSVTALASFRIARHSPAVVLLTMCLGVLVAQLDSSVVNLAVKHIGGELGGGVSALQWVLDAYNLVYASLLLTAGALGDLYGRRRLFAAGMALFLLGSIVCGLAPGIGVLIAGRALTGLGAAFVLPTSLAILSATYRADDRRAWAVGLWASCNGLALAIGPSIGGLLVDVIGWRSIFLLILPICALALLLAWRAVPEGADPRGRRLDPLGQALAILGLGAIAFAVIEGGHWGWRHPSILAAAGIAAIAFALFLAVEHRGEGGLVPLALFRKRAFSAALAVAALMTFGMYGMLFLLPVYLQTARGHSAFVAGIELLPASLTFVVVSSWSGRLAIRFGARAMTTAGMAAMGAGLLVLATLADDAPLWRMMAGLFVIGLGLGLNTGPVMTVAVANVPRARSGTASGLVNTARMVGATLGVALLGSIFAAATGSSAADPAAIAAGLRHSLSVGGAGELLGAFVAAAFIARSSHAAPQR
jgi:DHA2 family methylenomycin A resistance protein-like MFS transporter